MDHEDLARWIDGYERAWRTPGTDALGELFATGASYTPAPFDHPVRGLPAIAELWDAEREGPNENFSLTWAPVAVEGNVAVARVEVHYAGPPPRLYRDVWIVEFDEEGLCVAFEEWPFFPGRGRTAR